MATYGIRVNAAISSAGTTAHTANTNMYTAPANGYAIVQVSLQWASAVAGTAYIQITPMTVISYSSNPNILQSLSPSVVMATTALNNAQPVTIYVGPGQTLNMVNSGGSTVTWYVSGVEFTS